MHKFGLMEYIKTFVNNVLSGLSEFRMNFHRKNLLPIVLKVVGFMAYNQTKNRQMFSHYY